MGIPGIKTDKEKILKAIQDSDGIIYRAAKMLDICTDVIYELRKKDDEVAKAIQVAREKRERHKDDMIELIKKDMYSMLHAKMDSGDSSCIIYAMKTFGGHSDGSGININVVKKDPTVD